MNRALRPWMAVLAALGLGACASQAEREHARQQADTHIQLGLSYMQRGQLDFAKDNLTKAMELNPDSSVGHSMMALLQWRLKDFRQAERHFREALELNKDNSDARNNYGIFLCERGRFDDADREFRQVLVDPLYKTPAEANVNAGMCQMRKPSPTNAEKYFRAALSINPKQSQALFWMATLSFNDGRSVAARGFLQRYFQVGEDTPAVLLLASRVEGALGNRDAEASYAVRLRGKFPDSTEASELKGATGASPKGGNKVQR